MSPRYTIRKFAELAGVTVKALHHYDRLGLLKPSRKDSGYRVYGDRDLEILEQIIALKFLGLPLKEIAEILNRPALKWHDTLRMQRQALEDRQELLARAIRAIRAAEEAIESGASLDPAMLKHIIEVIDMNDDVSAMKKYYSEESWAQYRRYYEEGPSGEWRRLYSDAREMLNEDPASEKAQALVQRWYDLARRAHSGDPEVLTDSPAAWMDRANWPDAMKQRAAELGMEQVLDYIKRAELESRKLCFNEPTWNSLLRLVTQPPEVEAAHWRDRVELFRDLEAALLQDPAGEIAQALVRRWSAQLDRATGGNAEIKAHMLRNWSRRRYWPESMRWRVERLHMMSYERFERAADFLDRAAVISSGLKPKEEEKMTLKQRLLDEFDQEMPATRKILERVPDAKFSWKPHEKSMTLGRLANHVAEMPGAVAVYMKGKGSMRPQAGTLAELLESFDQNVTACREQLQAMTDERLAGNMIVNPGVERPVWAVLRGRGFMNHLIHHRGQLSVYLRLLDVDVPGMYGPSADEK